LLFFYRFLFFSLFFFCFFFSFIPFSSFFFFLSVLLYRSLSFLFSFFLFFVYSFVFEMNSDINFFVNLGRPPPLATCRLQSVQPDCPQPVGGTAFFPIFDGRSPNTKT